MIPVTKPYLPSREKLDKYIDGIYDRHWFTNNGELVQELTRRLEDYLGVDNLLLVANGTLALQIAYRALGLRDNSELKKPEAISTPFTFIATASSLRWEGIEPVFVDIDPYTWCLDPANIEGAITPNTNAIVPVHVFGNACDVEAIDVIAKKHNLKVIYDASHAFGVKYNGSSLLKHGDAATLSFHATKLFHTGEGGAIVFKRKEDLERAKKMINFGITGPEKIEELGINAKMSELQAALGLCLLDDMDNITHERYEIARKYNSFLNGKLQRQIINKNATHNYAYYPIVLKSECHVKNLIELLMSGGVFPRRYFYPSLDKVDFFNSDNNDCINSRFLSKRILCLPTYFGLPSEVINEISARCLEYA